MQEEMTSLPRWVSSFLKRICPEDLYEEIEGDLIQNFNRDVKQIGQRNAKRRMIRNVFRFVRPGIVFRNKFSFEITSLSMIRNYFTSARRHLLKNKVFSLINICGLAVGMAAFFLIVQYVSFEMSYDQFHENKDEIYRVALKQYENGVIKNTSAKSFSGIQDLIKENCPQVRALTRFMKIPANTGFLFGYDNKIYNEWGGVINADTNFFKVFPSLLTRGDVSTVLKNPNSLVISESIAKKIFGSADPMGQRIDRIDENGDAPYVVTGILKDLPENSHFHARFVGKLEEVWPDLQPWSASLIFNYVTLPNETDPLSVADQVNTRMRKVEKAYPQTKGTEIFLQPVTDVHLRSHLKDEFEPNGNEGLIFIMMGIAIVILVIAWINYVNIETARFLTRAKEVGVRRIIGSAKADLATQFLIEYFCMNVIASALAALLIFLVLPHFSYLTGIPIHSIQWTASGVWLMALSLFIIGSIIVGIYPALFLIKLNPISTLKGNFGGPNRRSVIRKSLMVVQFTTAIVLVAILLVIDSQLEYMRLTNKAMDVEKVISIRNPIAYSNQEVKDKHNNFKMLEQKLTQHPAIKMVSTSSAIPGAEIGFTFVDLLKRNLSDPYDPTRYKTIFVGENFIPLYGLKILAGRNFETEPVSTWTEPWDRKDWMKIILNEKAARNLGFKSAEEAVNQVVYFKLWDDFQPCEIIGIIKDYHHEAIKKEVFPMILKLNYNSFQQVYYSIRLSAGSNPQDAIAYIERSWREIFPGKPFEYFFLNDYYDQQFKSELHFSRIFTLFSAIAIFIACLGILGMTLFEANARLKEISIRKVLGASVLNLVRILSRDHIRVVVIAMLIAAPLIYFVARQWLIKYPVRIALSPMFFLVPFGIIAILVTLTSCFQTIKAANTNPVNHLKDE
jgi:putative ABC transport system permease protein